MLSRTNRILSQPAKQRIRPELPWEYGFAKYLGRKLTPAERAVIRPIEKARKTFCPRPFLVIDPPGVDSSELLQQFQRYYLSVMNDSYGIIIRPCGEKSRRDKRIIPISPRCGDHARGLSSGFTLMLRAGSTINVRRQGGQSLSDFLQLLRERWGSIVTERDGEKRQRVAEAKATSVPSNKSFGHNVTSVSNADIQLITTHLRTRYCCLREISSSSHISGAFRPVRQSCTSGTLPPR